jgi:hypothetical protein
MSPALLAVLFSILGLGLASTSTVCVVLWLRVRSLTSATVNRPSKSRPVRDTVAIPEPSQPPTRIRYEVARRLDDLAGRHLALEARLVRIEASTTEAARVIASEPEASKATCRVDPGRSATADGPTLISVPNLASPPSSTLEAAAELDRRFGPVWAMSDEGVPTETISRESGYPIGQVELILGLRRQLSTGGAAVDG